MMPIELENFYSDLALAGKNMQDSVKVFEDIGEILTLAGAAGKGGRRVVEADLSSIKDAVLVSQAGKVLWCGARSQFKTSALGNSAKMAQTISLGGRTVLPGFVEAHTHLVFAGTRAEEFEWRMQGQSYLDIAARGGGILSTVKATRAASEGELLQLASGRVQRFVQQGVTTIEIKSGYGLDVETELRCLRVARALRGPRIVTTYLGPHSRAPEHGDLESYMRQICDEVLPLIAREKLADRLDIYIEKGFFSLELAHRYFSAAKALGLPITAHVEQLSDSCGAELALDFDAQSVDHLVFANSKTISRLAKSKAVAVLLPASDLYMKMQYPPARELIDAGACVALSTDFNPGTSPTQDLSLVGVLARIEMKMSLPEVISAFTVGSATALGLDAHLGSLEVGKACDFMALDCSWRELFYSVGEHPVSSTVKNAHYLKI